jgi:lipoprotein NlpD
LLILSGHMAGKRKHSFYPFCNRTNLPANVQRICKLLIAVMFIIITACSGSLIGSKQASGVYHRVKKGDTLYKIAQVYHVSQQQVAEVNNIDHGEILEAGRILFIPDAQAVADDVLVAVKAQEATKNIVKKTPITPQKKPSIKGDGVDLTPASEKPGVKQPLNEQPSKEKELSQLSSTGKSEMASQPDKTIFPLKLPSVVLKESNNDENVHADSEQAKIQREKKLFLWPVVGKVVSRYGIQPNGMFFNGIKISALEGTPVIATADGVVIFSGPLKDYGETIILKHDNDYASVYTQLGQRLVKREDRLKKGDKIAILARSEMKGESLLNFEIRFKNSARNPLFFLP